MRRAAGLTLNADGSYSFDASNAAYQHLAAGATADVVVSYTVTDEHGATSTSDADDHRHRHQRCAGGGGGREQRARRTATITGTVATNDSDVDDGAVLSYALNGAAPAGLTLNADGSYSFDAEQRRLPAPGRRCDQRRGGQLHGDRRSTARPSTSDPDHHRHRHQRCAGGGGRRKQRAEDTTITGTVATNDSDVDDGAMLSYALNGAASGRA